MTYSLKSGWAPINAAWSLIFMPWSVMRWRDI